MNKKNALNPVSSTSMPNHVKENTKGRFRQTVVILTVACLVMMTGLVACSDASSKQDPPPASTKSAPGGTPAVTGEALLEARCSACHSADRPRKGRKSAEQWQRTVTRMMGKGAQLTDAEKQVLVDYLAKTYRQ